eukprot:6191827-Pleurochrysis_carterae.AAC.1
MKRRESVREGKRGSWYGKSERRSQAELRVGRSAYRSGKRRGKKTGRGKEGRRKRLESGGKLPQRAMHSLYELPVPRAK